MFVKYFFFGKNNIEKKKIILYKYQSRKTFIMKTKSKRQFLNMELFQIGQKTL